MPTILIDLGSTVPRLGYQRTANPDGTTAVAQLNLGLLALAWMPHSLTATMGDWMDQVRHEAHVAAAEQSGDGDWFEAATEADVQHLLDEDPHHGA